MKINTIIDIKNKNIFKIIDLIKNSDGLLKKDISKQTRLSMATVSNLCRDLKQAGLIIEETIESDDANVGRQPKLVRFNQNRFYIVCLDMHRSDEMRLVLLNLVNKIIDQEYFQLSNDSDLTQFTQQTRAICQRCCDRSGILYEDIIGVGVAVPAIFDIASERTVCSGIELLENQPFKHILEDVYQLPAFVYNESNLCVVSKQQNVMPSNNLAYILCSEGLGTGVVVNGQIVTGYMGYAVEACHTPIGDPSLTCELCGQTGCVQTDLSISGFISKYHKKQISASNVRIMEYWADFLDKISKNDSDAQRVIEENSIIFGRLISILVNLFDLEYIFIGGDILPLYGKMLPTIRREVEIRRIGKGRKLPKILPDNDNDTIIIGCAEQVFRNTLPIR